LNKDNLDVFRDKHCMEFFFFENCDKAFFG
jgi:hypothetical protein